MKIVADENIPEVAAAFADLGEVSLLPGREISPADLVDCQCLLVRTVTRVDAELLRGSAVEFVATATVGTDHVDQRFLAANHIGFSNAAGSNAEAAAEYVVAGIFALSKQFGFDPFAARIGIVGLGNIGGRLEQILSILGIDCMACDPPLVEAGDSLREYVPLDTLIKACDIISLHVPLTTTGQHPTFHMLDAQRLATLKSNCLLINAARGEIVDNRALSDLLERRDDVCVFLDTWEHEPRISAALMDQVNLATPHVAGYSVEGRLRATQMVLDAACRYFQASSGWQMAGKLPEILPLALPNDVEDLEFWQSLFCTHYDIWQDHDQFIKGKQMDEPALASHFDALRKHYPQRFEYASRTIPEAVDRRKSEMLLQLGFRLDPAI